MTDNLKMYLRERCKLKNFFCKNAQRKTDYNKVFHKSTECTKEILEARKNYILRRLKKLADSNTAPKCIGLY